MCQWLTDDGQGESTVEDAGVAADRERVRRYAVDGDERAFAELVSGHLAMVYAAARRQVRSAELAEEVTQATFVLLAGKAASLGPGVVVAAWLHRTAFYTARNLLRQQARRRRHERRASPMAEPSVDPRATAPTWQRLAPALDAGVASLREADRQAIVLRFFRRQSLAEVGRAMGISEDAAQMRVSRAVGKLRAFFARAGVTLDTVSLANVVWANAGAVAVPAGLAGRVLAGVRVARAGPTAAGGVAAAVGRAMHWARVRTVTAAATAALLGVVGATFVLQRIVIHGPRAATAADLRRE